MATCDSPPLVARLKARAAIDKTFVLMREQIVKYYELCLKNKGDPEMPEDRAEIPAESGNIYKNKEPTRSLRPVRRKLQSLNKQIQKELGTFNSANNKAKQASSGGANAASDSLHDQKCLICTVLFRNGTDVTLFPCGHYYHTEKCAYPWLKTGRNICPACQCELIVTDKEAPDDECASVALGAKWGWVQKY
jgi:hypothetical protein